MEDIKSKFEDVMRTDTTIQSLMGGTPQDPRVYPFYSGTAEITPEKPAFITYSLMDPTKTLAVGNPVFTVAIWTREWVRAERVLARLRGLFDQEIHITAAPNNRRLYTKVLNANDKYQQEPRYAGKDVQISAGWSAV